MKKLTIIFFTVLLLQASSTKAQITLDTTLVPSGQYNLFGYLFKTVQISETETKYFSADSATNTFNLLNMDFTPFMLNIALPEPIFYSGWYRMQVLYITRSLFDCDTSTIEYVYTEPTGPKVFYIMRTDGTQLFRLDSAMGPYCFGGCLGGSDWVKPIVNTSSGARLFLFHQVGSVTETNIYSLCGTLPTDVFDFTNVNQSFVKIFPNPTSASLTFQINLPDNMNEYELVIVDNNAKAMRREKINMGNDKYTIDVSSFSSGTYLYSLCTKDKTYQSGKFVINK